MAEDGGADIPAFCAVDVMRPFVVDTAALHTEKEPDRLYTRFLITCKIFSWFLTNRKCR